MVLRTLAAVAALGVIAGASVVTFGLYNVSARSGHLPGVAWMLHTTFRNAVELRAPPAEAVPELTPALAELGARHFDSACVACHAAPGLTRSPTILRMVPVPPHITVAVEGWSPAELHWIVYEGVKMSGMPHWPSVREDEVWSVVAFLRDVADGMEPAEYFALTETVDGSGAAYCAGCHGPGGRSENPHIPRLDILSADYVAAALRYFRTGERESGIMAEAISGRSEEEIERLSAIFSADAVEGEVLEGPAPAAPADPVLVETGRALALASSGDRDVPACEACHGPRRYEAEAPGPRLSGQHAAYLERQLHAWRAGVRGGGPRANLMRQAAAELSDDEIEALAAFYASGGR